MKARSPVILILLCLAAVSLGGCRRGIVRAAPPSVVAPFPAEPATLHASRSPAPITAPELPVPPPELVLFPSEEPRPPQPRPVTVETRPEPPSVRAEVPPPQISPILSAADQDRLTRRASDDIRAAERNLQLAAGRQLNALQNDLAEKIRGFLAQAHDAIRANDWVRAQNVAEKAQVLSADLVKSL